MGVRNACGLAPLPLPRPLGVEGLRKLAVDGEGWGSVGLPGREAGWVQEESSLAMFPRHVPRAPQRTAPGIPYGSRGREPAAIWGRGHLPWLAASSELRCQSPISGCEITEIRHGKFEMHCNLINSSCFCCVCVWGGGVVNHLLDESRDCCSDDSSILPSYPGARADSLTPPSKSPAETGVTLPTGHSADSALASGTDSLSLPWAGPH